jgi:hypothetical protein
MSAKIQPAKALCARRWRIEGTKRGQRWQGYVMAENHNEAVRKASRMLVLVTACVLQ